MESPEQRRREMLFYELRRARCKQGVHWRKLKVQSLLSFHWPSHGRLPLAELLLVKEEPFPPAETAV